MSSDEVRQPEERAPTSNADVELWSRFRSEKTRTARDELFALYAPYARTVAARHFKDRRGGDIEFPDLCQLAYTGLLEAIDRFDPDQGVPFKGYAARRISGSILDGLSKMSELREQASFRNRARYERARSLAASQDLSKSSGDALDALADLAIGLALGFILEDAGLYTPDDAPDRQIDAYDSLAFRDTVKQLTGALSSLPDREQTVIRCHYFNDLDFSQIGAILGVGRARVSQLHKAAIGRLHKRMATNMNFWLKR